MKLIFVLFVAFVYVNAFDFGEYNDTPESVQGDEEVDTPQPLALSTTNSTTTQAVVDLVTTTATPTTTQPSTTTATPTPYTTAPPMTTTSPRSPDNRAVEVIVTRSMVRLMDEAFRQHLTSFEHRIANLVLI